MASDLRTLGLSGTQLRASTGCSAAQANTAGRTGGGACWRCNGSAMGAAASASPHDFPPPTSPAEAAFVVSASHFAREEAALPLETTPAPVSPAGSSGAAAAATLRSSSFSPGSAKPRVSQSVPMQRFSSAPESSELREKGGGGGSSGSAVRKKTRADRQEELLLGKLRAKQLRQAQVTVHVAYNLMRLKRRAQSNIEQRNAEGSSTGSSRAAPAGAARELEKRTGCGSGDELPAKSIGTIRKAEASDVVVGKGASMLSLSSKGERGDSFLPSGDVCCVPPGPHLSSDYSGLSRRS
eukprot:COSAG06_NODE_667_length_13266_cov_25.994532_11_plen_296_part_00